MEKMAPGADVSSGSFRDDFDSLVESLTSALLAHGEDLPNSGARLEETAVSATIRRILDLGYRIEPPAGDGRATTFSASGTLVSQSLERLRLPEKLDIADLIAMWTLLSASSEACPPEIHRLLGDRILGAGEPIVAYDVLARGLDRWPADVRLRQLTALALARSGAAVPANRMLQGLYHEGHRDGETLGILARTHKDLAQQAENEAERRQQLLQAHRFYDEAYHFAAQTGDIDAAIYTGINAATTALLTGGADEASEVARRVRRLCGERLRSGPDYWALASLGEAAVVLGEWGEAERWYSKAAESAPEKFGHQSSTRHQARLLLEFLGRDRHRFDTCFRIPKILVFADLSANQVGPRDGQTPVARPVADGTRGRIAEALGKYGEKIGYSTISCPSDIFFLEEMARSGSEITIILPSPREEMERILEDFMPGEPSPAPFRAILDKAKSVIVAGKLPGHASTVVHEYANHLQNGLALLRARMLDTEVVPLVMAETVERGHAAGRCSPVETWRRHGVEPVIIELPEKPMARAHDGVSREPGPLGGAHEASIPGVASSECPQRIAAILVGDVKGFSGLSEENIPRFLRRFLGAVAGMIARLPSPPLAKNTWGDLVYFVFSNVADTGRFALDLQDLLCGMNGDGENAAGPCSLRIALHAGPVFTWTDPVIEQCAATGWHVVWPVRLEPKTPPGQVYASQAFAAMAAAEGIQDFACDYVGDIPLAKDFGTYHAYHVRRRRG